MDRIEGNHRFAWHQGFYGSMELELRQWKSALTFSKELELNKEPLVADMLVIKKEPGVEIDNPIARCYRTHNLLEYKSPEDTLSVDSFFKGLAYVYLYKSQGETENAVPITELTYSAYCVRHPKKLFSELQRVGFQVDRTTDGIYAVIGHPGLVIQVVVIKELALGTHSPLRATRLDADFEDAKRLWAEKDTLKDKRDLENYRTVLKLSMTANPELYKRLEEEGRMDEESVARYVFGKFFEKEHIVGKAEGKNEEKSEMITRMLRRHEPIEKIMEYTATTKDTIIGIADSMGIQLAV